MFGKSFCWIHIAMLCCVVLCECDAMKSMLLACQACEILFESVSVYFVRRYFSNFSYGIENHSTCIPRRSYSTLLLPSSPTPYTQTLARSLISVWGREKWEENNWTCVLLFAYKLIDYDWCDRTCWMKWNEETERERTTATNKNTTFLYLYNGKNTFTKLMRSAHFTRFVWHVWWCTVYKWANVKTFLT